MDLGAEPCLWCPGLVVPPGHSLPTLDPWTLCDRRLARQGCAILLSNIAIFPLTIISTSGYLTWAASVSLSLLHRKKTHWPKRAIVDGRTHPLDWIELLNQVFGIQYMWRNGIHKPFPVIALTESVEIRDRPGEPGEANQYVQLRLLGAPNRYWWRQWHYRDRSKFQVSRPSMELSCLNLNFFHRSW